MSNKILQSIYNFLKNFKDPQNNNPLDQDNANIQVVEKNGNVNVSLSITKQFLDQYQELSDILKENLSNIDGVLSVNVALTSESDVSGVDKN